MDEERKDEMEMDADATVVPDAEVLEGENEEEVDEEVTPVGDEEEEEETEEDTEM